MTSLSEESSSESRTRFEAGFLAAGLRAAGFLYFLHDFVWLKARAGLRVHSGWARPPGLPRLRQPRKLPGAFWTACVVLRHKLADSGTRGAGHPSGRWIPFFPSLLSIGAWRGAPRRGMRRYGLACETTPMQDIARQCFKRVR